VDELVGYLCGRNEFHSWACWIIRTVLQVSDDVRLEASLLLGDCVFERYLRFVFIQRLAVFGAHSKG